MNELLLQLAITLPVLLISLVFHEVSHGYVAYRLGDKTASERGRLSPNPLKHLDTFGTIVLLITFLGSQGRMMFGWAKPVPINPGNFKSHQRGMAWVGIAGPTANFILASVAALVLRTFYPHVGDLENSLLAIGVFRVFQLNIILMLFNLIPVPPLDGSRIIGAFLNRSSYMKWIQLDQYGMFFVMILLFVLINFGSGLTDIILPVYRLFLPSYSALFGL